MAHSHHDHGTTVIERDSSAGVAVAVVAILLAAFLVWMFFFSGWVGGGGSEAPAPREETRIEERNDGGDINVEVPGGAGGQTPESPAPTST